MSQILEGIRVLDFSRYVAGAYAGMLLADVGAEVIRVERPGGAEDREIGPLAPNGESLPFALILQRNKKSITLNLLTKQGEKLLSQLVERSQVVIHNFAPGSGEAKALDYNTLAQIKEDIVVAAISGFGQYGPYAHRPCFDSIAQAMAGGMCFTGFPGNPPTKAGVLYIDLCTGLHAALGIMFALYNCQKTGVGQMIDIALFDVATSCLNSLGVGAEYKLSGATRPQIGNHAFYTFGDSFKAKDGWVMLSAPGNSIWKRFIRVLGKKELAQAQEFSDDMARFQNRELIRPVVSAWVAERTVDEVVKILDQARVPCGPVNTIVDMVADPQLQAREMIVDVEYPGIGNITLPGLAMKLSRTPGKIYKRPPKLGEHSHEIFCGLVGLSHEDFSELKSQGVV